MLLNIGYNFQFVWIITRTFNIFTLIAVNIVFEYNMVKIIILHKNKVFNLTIE